jgi:hypothetical protein
MSVKFQLFVCSFFFIISGCVLIRYSEQLKTLREVGKAQSEIYRYIEEQEASFYKLKETVKNNQLQLGISKEEIVASYGEPVISREVSNNPPIKEVLLYRHPTHYFSSDRIYLYFDNSDRLTYWEYKPHQ